MSDTATMERYATQIPAAVRRVAENAERLRQQVSGETTTVVTDEPAPAAAPEPAPTVVEPPAPPPVQMELPPEPAPAPAPASADEGTWEQRYKTLEGKYRSETTQLRADVRAMQDEAANLRMLMATLQTAPAPASSAAPVAVPQEDAEAYGSDLITAAQRWAMAALQPQLDALQSEIASLKTTSKTTTTEVVKTRVDGLLDKEIPNWRSIDTSEAFHAWLDQVDPLSGAKRLPMLQAAYSQGEASRVLTFFRAYLAEHTAVSQPQGHTTAIPVEAPPTAQVPLEDLAAPGRSRPGSPAPQNETRIFTQSQIATFYRDVQKGSYRGREAEQQRLEAEIIRAGREGRVR